MKRAVVRRSPYEVLPSELMANGAVRRREEPSPTPRGSEAMAALRTPPRADAGKAGCGCSGGGDCGCAGRSVQRRRSRRHPRGQQRSDHGSAPVRGRTSRGGNHATGDSGLNPVSPVRLPHVPPSPLNRLLVPWGSTTPALPTNFAGFDPPSPPPTPALPALTSRPDRPPSLGNITQWDPTQPPGPDPGVDPGTGPVSGTDEFGGKCRLVPHPTNPGVNPGLVGVGSGSIAPGGLEPPWLPAQSTTMPDQFASGSVGGSTQAMAALAMASAARPASQAGQTADSVGGFVGELPLCPPGYYFDYNRQACYPEDNPAGPLQPGEQGLYACQCDWGESWIPAQSECWRWGSPPTPFQVGGIDVSGGEIPCAAGYTWDAASQSCVFEGCPSGTWELADGVCVDAPPHLACLSDDQLGPPPEFDSRSWGLGKCTGSNYTKLYVAFHLAYRAVRLAEEELDHFHSLSVVAKQEYWTDYETLPQSSLAYWFGDYLDVSGPMSIGPFSLTPTVLGRLHIVRTIVKELSRDFRHGHTSIHDPVFMYCRSKECAGWIDRHGSIFMIELCPEYFDLDPDDRATYMMHEMMHYSSGAYPRDRNNPLCTNFDSDCYSDDLGQEPVRLNDNTGLRYYVGETYDSAGQPTFVSDPRRLVRGAEEGDESALRDMMLNIDNYMCWIWNRYADRVNCILI